MISRLELKKIAETKRLTIRNTEKDYLLELLLFALSDDRRSLVFKGGTHSDTLRIIPNDKMRQLQEAGKLPAVKSKNSDHFKNFMRTYQQTNSTAVA